MVKVMVKFKVMVKVMVRVMVRVKVKVKVKVRVKVMIHISKKKQNNPEPKTEFLKARVTATMKKQFAESAEKDGRTVSSLLLVLVKKYLDGLGKGV